MLLVILKKWEGCHYWIILGIPIIWMGILNIFIDRKQGRWFPKTLKKISYYIYLYMKYIINESQYVHLLENSEKNKKFLTKLMGVDFTDKIQKVTSSYDVPMEFDEGISPVLIKMLLNHHGDMYLFELDGEKYLYQDRDEFEWFLGEDGYDYVDNEITEKLNIDVMGLRFSDIIDMYFNEGED
jgi:hypothetical protein